MDYSYSELLNDEDHSFEKKIIKCNFYNLFLPQSPR